LVLSDPDFRTKLPEKDDKYSDIRDAIKNKDKSALFSSILSDVSKFLGLTVFSNQL